eukprot:SAG31_NODE_14844_length_785_cov_0.816327_1_plen_74_part_00
MTLLALFSPCLRTLWDDGQGHDFYGLGDSLMILRTSLDAEVELSLDASAVALETEGLPAWPVPETGPNLHWCL